MAEAPYRWIGPVTKFEQPNSPDVSRTRDMETWLLSYEGPYDLLYASQPAWGTTLPGLPSDVKTGACQVVRDVGNIGKLTIRAARVISGGPAFYRRRREECQRRITLLPRYSAQAGQPGFFYGVNEEQFLWLDRALEDFFATAPSASNPAWEVFHAKYPNTPADIPYIKLVLGQAPLYELWGKIKAGTDSYVVGVPIIEETKHLNSDPGSGQISILEAPPAASNYPSGYIWVRVCDDAAQEGDYPIWTRSRKWAGFDHVDPDIYP
ncbi:MAG: hypothetical protein PCFJNLEI_00319 [Verrucomicrobiae bacterium]|nr:hypothetical protein [Verrucomicrobiae bacterium]